MPSHYLIRPGRTCDTAALARLQASVQLQSQTGGAPHPGIAAWVEDLMDTALIPPAALLQLALGHRTWPEILDAWPDALALNPLTEHFLTAAFPRLPAHLWPRN